ncbi:hypothetical protein KKC65_03595 [Patescibacteria group bacterium]|nr:hypothetical protein [Patescibacteria group bacterium]
MTNQRTVNILRKYRKSSASKKQRFFDSFEKRMIYRTTKTENPETTRKMVDKVLKKLLRNHD